MILCKYNMLLWNNFCTENICYFANALKKIAFLFLFFKKVSNDDKFYETFNKPDSPAFLFLTNRVEQKHGQNCCVTCKQCLTSVRQYKVTFYDILASNWCTSASLAHQSRQMKRQTTAGSWSSIHILSWNEMTKIQAELK